MVSEKCPVSQAKEVLVPRQNLNGRAPPYIGGRSVGRVHLGFEHFSDTTKFDSIWKTQLIKSE